MLFALSSSYRGSKGTNYFLYAILRFSCRGITPALSWSCCCAVGLGVQGCLALSADLLGLELCAELHFGAQNKLTLGQKVLFDHGAPSSLPWQSLCCVPQMCPIVTPNPDLYCNTRDVQKAAHTQVPLHPASRIFQVFEFIPLLGFIPGSFL